MNISVYDKSYIFPGVNCFGTLKPRVNAVSYNADLKGYPYSNCFGVSFCGIERVNRIEKINHHKQENYTGCIIGGAIGDALGSPVEFLNSNQIKKFYGSNGIEDLQTGISGSAEISDDTQMTFFTADGLIKAIGTDFKSNEIPDMNIVYESYLDWLKTQENNYPQNKSNKGWISQIPDLYSSRSPGDTCLKSLKSGKMGTISNPINNSKGNGGVMRAAPAGLLYYNNPQNAFEVGARCAAITHGHPSGYLSAGVFSSIISYIVKGYDFNTAVDKSIKILEKYKNHEEVKEALLKAKKLAASDIEPEKAISQIGGGWVGEEAIAIAVYCALKSPDNFENAVKMAVNHNGDSDSTGAVTGNIMGLYLGQGEIPKKWQDKVEMSNELKVLSSDLFLAPSKMQKIRNRYPYNMGRVPNWYETPKVKQNAVKIKYVRFFPQDEAKMESMTPAEKIEYKKYLLKNKRYNLN